MRWDEKVSRKIFHAIHTTDDKSSFDLFPPVIPFLLVDLFLTQPSLVTHIPFVAPSTLCIILFVLIYTYISRPGCKPSVAWWMQLLLSQLSSFPTDRGTCFHVENQFGRSCQSHYRGCVWQVHILISESTSTCIISENTSTCHRAVHDFNLILSLCLNMCPAIPFCVYRKLMSICIKLCERSPLAHVFVLISMHILFFCDI